MDYFVPCKRPIHTPMLPRVYISLIVLCNCINRKLSYTLALLKSHSIVETIWRCIQIYSHATVQTTCIISLSVSLFICKGQRSSCIYTVYGIGTYSCSICELRSGKWQLVPYIAILGDWALGPTNTKPQIAMYVSCTLSFKHIFVSDFNVWLLKVHVPGRTIHLKANSEVVGFHLVVCVVSGSIWFEIWGVVESGQKISIFPGKFPKNFDFFRKFQKSFVFQDKFSKKIPIVSGNFTKHSIFQAKIAIIIISRPPAIPTTPCPNSGESRTPNPQDWHLCVLSSNYRLGISPVSSVSAFVGGPAWSVVLKPGPGSVAHSLLLHSLCRIHSPAWKKQRCLNWTYMYIAVVGLGAPPSRFLQGALYRFSTRINEWIMLKWLWI